MEFPKTVIGADGILRCEVEPDPDWLPKVENSLGLHFLGVAEKVVEERGDQIFLTNASLALQGIEQDNLSYATITYTTFIRKVKLLSRAFNHFGVGKGDVVALYIPNTTEFHCMIVGTWLVQGIVSAGDPYLTVAGLASQLEEAKPKVVVCFPGNKDKMLEAIQQAGLGKSTKLIVLSLEEAVETSDMIFSYVDVLKKSETFPEIPSHHFMDPFCKEDTSVIIWSSGTTGKPKGILSSAHAVLSTSRIVEMDFIQTTCFFHTTGIVGALGRLEKKMNIYFFPIESLETENCAELVFQAAESFKPMTIFAGSHHIMRIQAAPTKSSEKFELSSVMFVVPIGSSVPHDVEMKLRKHFPKLVAIFNIYAQTEFGHKIANSCTPKNLGFIAPGVELKIVNASTGKTCGPNETGEIMVRGIVKSKGYLNRQEENAKLFGADGFLHTGDLGHYDNEGVLYYDGRLKEVIKYQNIHVYPAEIEQLIETHPDVVQAGVFGKEHQEDQEHPTAVVVKKEGSGVTKEDIENLVKSKLDRARWLRGGVYFVDQLPCNAQGKVQRKRLNDMITELEK